MYFWSYLAHFFLEWEMFQTKFVEKIKTHILCSMTFFFENCAVYEIMWKKYCRAGQAADDNMAHAHCMLDTYGYKYTIRICNSYCFSTAKMVLRIHISVTRTLSVFFLASGNFKFFVILEHIVFKRNEKHGYRLEVTVTRWRAGKRMNRN